MKKTRKRHASRRGLDLVTVKLQSLRSLHDECLLRGRDFSISLGLHNNVVSHALFESLSRLDFTIDLGHRKHMFLHETCRTADIDPFRSRTRGFVGHMSFAMKMAYRLATRFTDCYGDDHDIARLLTRRFMDMHSMLYGRLLARKRYARYWYFKNEAHMPVPVE